MNYIHNTIRVQQVDNAFPEYLKYQSNLSGFHNTETTVKHSTRGGSPAL